MKTVKRETINTVEAKEVNANAFIGFGEECKKDAKIQRAFHTSTMGLSAFLCAKNGMIMQLLEVGLSKMGMIHRPKGANVRLIGLTHLETTALKIADGQT